MRKERVYVKKIKNGYEVTVAYYDDETGKRKFRRVSVCKDKESAETLKSETEILLKNGVFDNRPKIAFEITLSECINSELSNEKKRRIANKLSVSTYKTYEGYLENVIDKAIGSFKIRALNNNNIQKFIDTLAEEYSYSTINVIYSILKKGIKYALKNNYIDVDPSLNVNIWSSKEKEELENYLEKDGALDLINKTKDVELRIQSIIAFTLGLRISEVLGLSWTKINLDRRMINISQIIVLDKKNRPILQQFPKGKNPMICFIPDMLYNALCEYKTYWDAKAEKYGYENQMLFFNKKTLSPEKPNTVTNRFSRNAEKQGYDITFHGLRHSFATMLHEEGVTDSNIGKALNHKNGSNVTSIYTHFSDKSRKNIQNVVDFALAES